MTLLELCSQAGTTPGRQSTVKDFFIEVFGTRLTDKFGLSEGEMVNFLQLAYRRMKYDKETIYMQYGKLLREADLLRQSDFRDIK